MLKEIAIADAYGAGFEFSSPDKISSGNKLNRYFNHELYGTIGKYTDDTQMSIAICEALLSFQPWNDQLVAQKLVECFKRDSRPGYSKGFYELLQSVNNGAELLQRITPNSERNGAAVRSIPIGFMSTPSTVIKYSNVQAKVTHNTKIGIRSSTTVALIAHYGIHQSGHTDSISKFLHNYNLNIWNLNWNKEASVHAYDTLSAALTCLASNNSLSDILKNSVELGGDTDSVAAIAVGLGSCFKNIENDLPKTLFNELNEPDFGIPYLDQLESNLHTRVHIRQLHN